MSDSLREALSEAFEKAEKEEVVQPSSQPEASTPAAEAKPDQTTNLAAKELQGEASSQPKTGEKPTETQDEKPAAAKPQEKSAAAPSETKPGEEKAGEADPFPKAPVSWKPASREKWATLPKEVREEVTRRERDVDRVLNETAGVRKFANEFNKVIEPYIPLLKFRNTPPLVAIDSMMRTAYGLNTGNDQTKAEIIAEVIDVYKVDPAVLDKVLAARLGGQGRQPVQQRQAQPSYAPLPPEAQEAVAFVQNLRQTQQQNLSRAVQEDLSTVQSEEFFEDLRETMAGILEAAANRGKVMTVKQAYERACQIDPEVSGILAQRRAAQEAQTNNQNLARAKAAASTVAGSPRNPLPAGVDPNDRRAVIAAQFGE